MPRSAERTRKRILEGAYKLFRRQGYSRVTMDAIAAEARFTKRTLYHHFNSKDVWETPDTVQALLTYPGGVQAHFEGTFSNAHMGARIEFLGTDASLYIDRGRYELIPERGRGKADEMIVLRIYIGRPGGGYLTRQLAGVEFDRRGAALDRQPHTETLRIDEVGFRRQAHQFDIVATE